MRHVSSDNTWKGGLFWTGGEINATKIYENGPGSNDECTMVFLVVRSKTVLQMAFEEPQFHLSV